MPNLGPDYDFAIRLKRIEDQLSRMGQNALGQLFSASQSDGSLGVTIGQRVTGDGSVVVEVFQGPTTPRDPQTGLHPPLFYAGETFVGGVASDSAVAFFYPDETVSMIVGAGGVGISDAAGNVVFTTDQPAGEGLGKPYLSMPLPVPAALPAWAATNATSWGTVAYSQVVHQSPKVAWTGYVVADAGTTGQVRLNVGGTYSAVMPITTTTSVVNTVVTLPAGFQGQTQTIAVEAQVTGGTGSVRIQTLSMYGRGS